MFVVVVWAVRTARYCRVWALMDGRSSVVLTVSGCFRFQHVMRPSNFHAVLAFCCTQLQSHLMKTCGSNWNQDHLKPTTGDQELLCHLHVYRVPKASETEPFLLS